MLALPMRFRRAPTHADQPLDCLHPSPIRHLGAFGAVLEPPLVAAVPVGPATVAATPVVADRGSVGAELGHPQSQQIRHLGTPDTTTPVAAQGNAGVGLGHPQSQQIRYLGCQGAKLGPPSVTADAPHFEPDLAPVGATPVVAGEGHLGTELGHPQSQQIRHLGELDMALEQ